MKLVKSLMLGSAAGLVAMSGAQAADLPLKAKAVEYVKICSLYGAGFYYIPGTDTCIKFSGYLRADVTLNGSDYAPALGTNLGAHNRLSNYYYSRSRMDFDIDTRTATEYGVLRTYADLVFTWTTGNYSQAGLGTTYAGDGVGGATLGLYHAFIQFAGFTIGRTYSIFDTPWQSYPAGGPDTIPGGSNHVTGVNQLTYTFDLGQGMSASLSAQDPAAGQDDSNVWNLAALSTSTFVNGAYGVSSIGGTRSPDLLGQFRIDQAWGLFQVMGVAHEIRPSYYGATELTGHPDNKWGFAVGAGLSIKNIPTGPGDSINVQAVYTDGASRYNFQSLMPTAYGIYGGTGVAGAYQSIGLASVADGVFVPGGSVETATTWGLRGGFTHNWDPHWASAIYGGYAALRYGSTAKSTICSAAFVAALALTGNCNPDFNLSVLGGNVVWTPVKGFAFTVDVNWTHLDQKYSGTIFSPGVASIAKPAATYELKNQDSVSMLIRAQRNF